MLGAIAIDRWAGTWRGTGGVVLALLLVVVGAKASASPPGFVGPVDVERWKPGPVYVLELKGGGKYGLFPEVFDD